MIVLWAVRADTELAAEPVLNVGRPRCLRTRESEQYQVHVLLQVCRLEWPAGVTHSGALRSERGPAFPTPVNGCHRPKIAVCDTSACSLGPKVHADVSQAATRRPSHVPHVIASNNHPHPHTRYRTRRTGTPRDRGNPCPGTPLVDRSAQQQPSLNRSRQPRPPTARTGHANRRRHAPQSRSCRTT